MDGARAAVELFGIEEKKPELLAAGADARAEAANLREQIAERRAELRTVERDFRRDIDALNANLQFWTIGLPPALIILAGIAGSLFRRRRRA